MKRGQTSLPQGQATIDACAMLVTRFRLELPAEENDLFEKLARRGAISGGMAEMLKRMKWMRNILVHEYGRINDELVFETVRERLGDFGTFRREILSVDNISPPWRRPPRPWARAT